MNPPIRGTLPTPFSQADNASHDAGSTSHQSADTPPASDPPPSPPRPSGSPRRFRTSSGSPLLKQASLNRQLGVGNPLGEEIPSASVASAVGPHPHDEEIDLGDLMRVIVGWKEQGIDKVPKDALLAELGAPRERTTSGKSVASSGSTWTAPIERFERFRSEYERRVAEGSASPSEASEASLEYVGLLGSGGEASVVAVKETRSGKHHAVKLFSAQQQERVERETAQHQLAASIVKKVPNAMQIRQTEPIEIDDQGMGPMVGFMSEYIAGKESKSWFDGARQTVGEPAFSAKEFFLEAGVLGGGLAVGAAGINFREGSHGDIKPENAMVSPTGEATLIDFGYLQEHGKPPRVSTVLYSPPEIFCNPRKNPESSVLTNEKLDVFSFGQTVCEWVTGRPLNWGNIETNEPLPYCYQGMQKSPEYRKLGVAAVKEKLREHFDQYLPSPLKADDVREEREQCLDMLAHCLAGNPDERITHENLLKLPFLHRENVKRRDIRRIIDTVDQQVAGRKAAVESSLPEEGKT